MADIDVTSIRYGPNPFSIQQGGLFSYEFTVNFANGTPPGTFTYDIYALSPTQEVMKHWTDSVPTNGQSQVNVGVAFPLQTEDNQPFPFGDFRNRFVVSAEGCTTWDQYHCSGGHVRPDSSSLCPPESTMRRMS
jgi:hypothetical protein